MAAVAVLLMLAQQSFAAQTYKVRSGDTLYKIAKKFGTTISLLQKTNHLKSPDIIRTGQILTIPAKIPAPPPVDPITYGRANEGDLEVVSDGKLLTTLAKDARFVVVAREGDKFNVKLEDGRTGWVKADAVTLEETRKPLPVSDPWSVKRDVVRTAYAYRGAKYRFGGASSRQGFDCSGFVMFVYGTKGITLPHSSQALFKCGKPVAKSDLQPGDMVFFANTYRRGISHVGIYIGDGKFIHASRHSRGVRIDQLDAAYYKAHYAGARRI